MNKILIILYRIVYFFHELKIPLLAEIINKIFIRILFGCQLQTGVKIGKNVILGNGGLGIVIHRHVTIEDSVIVAPNVTIAGTSMKEGAPYIGANTIIGTGARVLGPIKIGKNCYIGANAVIIADVPDNSMVVGIPGKIIKLDIDIFNYR